MSYRNLDQSLMTGRLSKYAEALRPPLLIAVVHVVLSVQFFLLISMAKHQKVVAASDRLCCAAVIIAMVIPVHSYIVYGHQSKIDAHQVAAKLVTTFITDGVSESAKNGRPTSEYSRDGRYPMVSLPILSSTGLIQMEITRPRIADGLLRQKMQEILGPTILLRPSEKPNV